MDRSICYRCVEFAVFRLPMDGLIDTTSIRINLLRTKFLFNSLVKRIDSFIESQSNFIYIENKNDTDWFRRNLFSSFQLHFQIWVVTSFIIFFFLSNYLDKPTYFIVTLETIAMTNNIHTISQFDPWLVYPWNTLYIRLIESRERTSYSASFHDSHSIFVPVGATVLNHRRPEWEILVS